AVVARDAVPHDEDVRAREVVLGAQLGPEPRGLEVHARERRARAREPREERRDRRRARMRAHAGQDTPTARVGWWRACARALRLWSTEVPPAADGPTSCSRSGAAEHRARASRSTGPMDGWLG